MSITALFQADAGCCSRSPDDGRPAAADGDEVDLPSVDARQLGVVDHLAVEVEPLGVGAGDLVPELHEPHQFAVLIGAGQVGVGVAQAAAGLLQGEEGQHARPGLAPAAAGNGGRAPAGSPR